VQHPKKETTTEKKTHPEKGTLKTEIGIYPKELLVSKNLGKTSCHMT